MYSTVLFTVGDDEKAEPSRRESNYVRASVCMQNKEKMFSSRGLQAETG